MILGNRLFKASITSEVSSTDNVVCVIKQRLSSSFTFSFHTSSGDSTKYIPPSGLLYCPIVPSTSGCPAWPIKMASLPLRLALATSICTLVTKGQVASKSIVKLRERASWRIA